MQRPQIDYPCQWQFRLIGPNPQGLRAVIAAEFGEHPHVVRDGHTSSGGKYCSVEVSTEVASEQDRDGRFAALAAAEGVLTVL